MYGGLDDLIVSLTYPLSNMLQSILHKHRVRYDIVQQLSLVLSASHCLGLAISVSLGLSQYVWDELSQFVLVCVQLYLMSRLSLSWSVSMCLE